MLKQFNNIATAFWFLPLLVLLDLFPSSRSHAQEEPYYKGKTIRFVVGLSAGGFYDLWPRLVARHMGKYIPGNPAFVVQNMPGAGSIIAANYVYGVAKPDGLTLGAPHAGIYSAQLSGQKEVQYDIRKFNWIGSPVKNPLILYMRADAPYKNIDDLLKAKEPAKCGGSGVVSSDYILAKVLQEALGVKIETVLGYAGGTEIDMAVEKGEVVCRGMIFPAHFGREPFTSWHKNGFDRHILQTSQKRDPRAPEAPTIYEVMDRYKTSEASRRVVRVVLSGSDFGQPIVVAPGTPPERIKLLRDGYAAALKDAELLAEAQRAKMDVEFVSSEELQSLAQEVMNQPADVLERVKKIMGN
jgi:tripartite-type tricarboxylate transporter receptor subunit TctC